MTTLLKTFSQHSTLYIMAFFLLFTGFWYARSEVPRTNQMYSTGQYPTPPPSVNTIFSPDASNVTVSANEQLEALKKQVAIAPDDTTHLARLARILQDAHQPQEAITYYSRYLTLRPKNRQAWLDLANIQASLNRWEDALITTRTMLSHYPSDASGQYNLGAIYANQGMTDDARRTWSEVATQEVDTAMAQMAQESLQRLNAFLKPPGGMQ